LDTLRPSDLSLLEYIEGGFDSVGKELEAIRLRAALQEALRLASIVNQYLDQTAPWSAVKRNKYQAALTVFTALKAIDSLKILFAPFLPFSSEKLHRFFDYQTPLFGEQYTQDVEDPLGSHRVLRYRPRTRDAQKFWQPSNIQPGSKLNPPEPLFKKLDESTAEMERSRLGV